MFLIDRNVSYPLRACSTSQNVALDIYVFASLVLLLSGPEADASIGSNHVHFSSPSMHNSVSSAAAVSFSSPPRSATKSPLLGVPPVPPRIPPPPPPKAGTSTTTTTSSLEPPVAVAFSPIPSTNFPLPSSNPISMALSPHEALPRPPPPPPPAPTASSLHNSSVAISLPCQPIFSSTVAAVFPPQPLSAASYATGGSNLVLSPLSLGSPASLAGPIVTQVCVGFGYRREEAAVRPFFVAGGRAVWYTCTGLLAR